MHIGAEPDDKRRAMRVALSQRVKEDLSTATGPRPVSGVVIPSDSEASSFPSASSSSPVQVKGVPSPSSSAALAASAASSSGSLSPAQARDRVEAERKRREEVEKMFANLNTEDLARKNEFAYNEK